MLRKARHELTCTLWLRPLAAPDVGVDSDIAHLYFRQLISGLVSCQRFSLTDSIVARA